MDYGGFDFASSRDFWRIERSTFARCKILAPCDRGVNEVGKVNGRDQSRRHGVVMPQSRRILETTRRTSRSLRQISSRERRRNPLFLSVSRTRKAQEDEPETWGPQDMFHTNTRTAIERARTLKTILLVYIPNDSQTKKREESPGLEPLLQREDVQILLSSECVLLCLFPDTPDSSWLFQVYGFPKKIPSIYIIAPNGTLHEIIQEINAPAVSESQVNQTIWEKGSKTANLLQEFRQTEKRKNIDNNDVQNAINQQKKRRSLRPRPDVLQKKTFNPASFGDDYFTLDDIDVYFDDVFLREIEYHKNRLNGLCLTSGTQAAETSCKAPQSIKDVRELESAIDRCVHTLESRNDTEMMNLFIMNRIFSWRWDLEISPSILKRKLRVPGDNCFISEWDAYIVMK
eukprot:763865-Hanusia_phi.AAC.4